MRSFIHVVGLIVWQPLAKILKKNGMKKKNKNKTKQKQKTAFLVADGLHQLAYPFLNDYPSPGDVSPVIFFRYNERKGKENNVPNSFQEKNKKRYSVLKCWEKTLGVATTPLVR